MATVTRTTTWSDNQVLTASALNGEFNNLLNALALTNSDISGSAAIAYSKLNLSGSIVNADISASAAIVYSKLSLTGGIVNADISSSAAISTSKINTTFPAGTIVGTSDSQTLTNKTLTNPTINGSTQAYTSDGDAATITFDLSASNLHTVTLGGNRTLALSNAAAGKVFIIRLVQDGTGSRTVTWFSTIKWPGGSAPTLTTTASAVDTFGFICTGTNTYDGYIIGQNLS